LTLDNKFKDSCFGEINMTPDDELENEQVIEYMKYLLIKIKRHLEKKPILNSSNYSFTDKLEKEESL